MITKRYLVGIAVLLLTVGFVGPGGWVGAADNPATFELGTSAPPKGDAHIRLNMAFDVLEGGETIGTALPIPGLPYTDTGATCDNWDDYDEVCPYTGSWSPDVVYSYMPAVNEMIDVDLYGSTYDTKVYIYDQFMALIACNDDFYPDYVSKLEGVALTGGITYYIVVDGYGGDCGDYMIEVLGTLPCVIACPSGGIPEGEPPLTPGYIDTHNGACNTDPDFPPFQYVNEYSGCSDYTTICGVSGWYDDGFRDTDWFIATVGPTGTVTITVDAEFPTYLFELWPQDCYSVAVVQNVEAGPCNPASLDIMGPPGSEIWFWVGPTTFLGPTPGVIEYNYTMHVTGHEAPPAIDTPPEITVELNRDCLWPPNHKMVDIFATVTVTDDECCGSPPTFVLTSVTSNEPDNGKGDGNTVDDIQDASIGTDDTHIRLRSERSGRGDGRIYTIVYTATDCSGQTTDATVYVRVPHDQSGGACASMGFAPGGVELDPALREFALVIRTQPGFDATKLDVAKTYIGNTIGVATPNRSMTIDNDADGRMDLVVFYSARSLSIIGDGTEPVGLHYTSEKGVDYLVSNIFALGEPVPLIPSVVIPRKRVEGEDKGLTPKVTTLLPSYPNPFNPSTTIPFNLVSPERVTLRIYDAQGALVRTLKNEDYPAGVHRVIWDGRDNNGHEVATGAYFVRFTAGSVVTTHKLMLIR